MKYQQDWTRQILAGLNQAANPQYAAVANHYIKTNMRVLGIRAPVLEQFVKDMRERLAAAPSGELIALSKALAGSEIFEARQLAYLMLSSRKEVLAVMSLSDLEALGEGMDNWASVDTFSTLLAGMMWKNGQLSDQDIQNWARRENVWWRRAALVSTIPLNQKSKGGQGDLHRTLAICDLLKSDSHRMVQKAVSWALRQLARHYPLEVSQYIDQNRSQMASTTFTEVSRKLAEISGKKQPGNK